MHPHQQRVVDEKEELDDKIQKLEMFIDNPIGPFGTLANVEQGRLRKQGMVMREYTRILAERIAAFPE